MVLPVSSSVVAIGLGVTARRDRVQARDTQRLEIFNGQSMHGVRIRLYTAPQRRPERRAASAGPRKACAMARRVLHGVLLRLSVRSEGKRAPALHCAHPSGTPTAPHRGTRHRACAAARHSERHQVSMISRRIGRARLLAAPRHQGWRHWHILVCVRLTL